MELIYNIPDIYLLIPFYIYILVKERKVIGINRFNMSLRFTLGMIPSLTLLCIYIGNGVAVNILGFFTFMIIINFVPLIAGIAIVSTTWHTMYPEVAVVAFVIYASLIFISRHPRRF